MTDPIADLLTRIRNAILSKKRTVSVPYSRMKVEIVRILKEESYIFDAHEHGEGVNRLLEIVLKYTHNQPAIHTLKKISKPGCRIYVKTAELPVVQNNFGIAIVSTSRGVMTNRKARELHLGGEVLCEIS